MRVGGLATAATSHLKKASSDEWGSFFWHTAVEGVDGSLEDADARERVWIRHFLSAGAELTNIQYMD